MEDERGMTGTKAPHERVYLKGILEPYRIEMFKEALVDMEHDLCSYFLSELWNSMCQEAAQLDRSLRETGRVELA